MAWVAVEKSHAALIRSLWELGLIRDERVRNAMMNVDRADFCPNEPYTDSSQKINFNSIVSAPHMHAEALERLKNHLREGNHALDVGSGTGYLTACMALMVGKSGKAYGIEHINELVEQSIENIKKNHADLIISGQLVFVNGDGRNGYLPGAPYHAIHLVKQLAPGGRMVIPLGPDSSDQRLTQVDKNELGEITFRKLQDVLFMPLTDRKDQLDGYRLNQLPNP